MPEFLIVLLIWLGLLDPTATYTVSQVETIATNNASWIQQATPTVDTTATSWLQAREHYKEVTIIDPGVR